MAAGVLIALGSLLLNWYGDARYDAGYAQSGVDQKNAAAQAGSEAANELERIRDDTRNLSVPDIDKQLTELGIMRHATDY